jgi:RHS repeat-associated protein
MWIHGPGIDEPLASQNQAPGFTANWKYRHLDGLGSLVKTVNASGVIISSVDYDAFGNGGTVTGYGFTGREFDPETGLLYYRARYYDPKIGRFVSEDPIGFDGDQINLFPYVANNPVNLNDPSGLLGKGHQTGGTVITPWGIIPPSWQRKYEPTTTYYGAEGHAFLGTGLTSVTCTDECGHDRTFRFIKVCLGGAAGAGFSGGRVMGMSGKKCRADSYRGWFYEAGFSAGRASGGADVGYLGDLTSGPGLTSGVWEFSGGGGWGAEFKSTWCYYFELP